MNKGFACSCLLIGKRHFYSVCLEIKLHNPFLITDQQIHELPADPLMTRWDFWLFFGISFTKFLNTLSDSGVFTSSDLCLLHLGSRCQKNLLPSFFCLVSDSAAVGLNRVKKLWQIGS